MKKQIYDLFPLTVLKEKINLSAAEKEKLVKFIFQSEKNTFFQFIGHKNRIRISEH